MADSERQKIVNAIIARMQGISVAAGYQTDLGANVRDWETHWDDAELPAISVCDLIQEDVPFADEAWTKYKLPVQLRIFTSSSARAADIRKMIADVFQAIRIDQRWTVDGTILAEKTEYLRDGLIVPEDEFRVAGGAVEINIFYYTHEFNAYE